MGRSECMDDLDIAAVEQLLSAGLRRLLADQLSRMKRSFVQRDLQAANAGNSAFKTFKMPHGSLEEFYSFPDDLTSRLGSSEFFSHLIRNRSCT